MSDTRDIPTPSTPADGSLRRGRLFVITGPSGVGKSTVRQRVIEQSGAVYSVSATTRRPRPGEQDGRDYRFLDRARFEELVDRGQMLEWAEVFGHYYGTPAEPVDAWLAAGQNVILEIDVQGGLQVARRRPEAVFILIAPPDEATLKQRLAGRGTESEEDLARRLGKATDELATARASGVYTNEVINDDLDRAVEAVRAIIRKETQHP